MVRFKLLTSFATFLGSLFLLAACEMPAINNGHVSQLAVDPIPPSGNSNVQLKAECFDERFTQTASQVTQSLDLLFVNDTSGSLDDERLGVAQGIDSFVAALPSGFDYQVGVMLAHGSQSCYAGRLWSATSDHPKVSSSKTMSLSTIRANLAFNLTHVATDYYSDGGEEGLYSLSRGLQGNELAESRSLGFFRPDAALAVVFISDENDICAVYPAGVSRVADPENLEGPAKIRDCAGITPDTVLAKIKALKGNMPSVLGAVVYSTNVYPRLDQNEYGWGYMDLVKLAQGVSVDIATGQYATGLANIGKLAATQIQLIYDFTLSRPEIDPTTIKVSVDGTDAVFNFDSTGNDVHIPSPGRAQSIIDVNYCLKIPVPAPSPSPTTPVPTPSPTPCLGSSCGGAIGV